MIKFTKAAVIGGGIAAVAVVTATAAFAATTYHISAGTQKTGTINYTATATGTSSAPAIKFTDTTSKTTLNCQSATASGVMKLGSAVAASRAGSITKTTWTKCSGLGLTFFPKQVGTWYINGSGPTSSTGVTKVYIGNVVANVTSGTAGCTFTVKGSADGTYTNSTGKLAMAPRAGSGHTLKLSNVSSSCFGVLNNGDTTTFTGTYVVSTAKGKIKIS